MIAINFLVQKRGQVEISAEGAAGMGSAHRRARARSGLKSVLRDVNKLYLLALASRNIVLMQPRVHFQLRE